ncbi:unnamed protein product [Ambrosiozyma monospora]|uniref:Unnamed protein product n=1 Tax=Ambrosiozyma monospora TaxID=43982 RepID=A0A9W7DHC0_AMBMO|nr:unnamed protein product [Ambrosiozyma monospora]
MSIKFSPEPCLETPEPDSITTSPFRKLKHRNTHSIHYDPPQIRLSRRLSQVSPAEALELMEFKDKLRLYGILVLVCTWTVFVVGMGSVFNLWGWCFSDEVLDRFDGGFITHVRQLFKVFESQNETVDNYYVYCFFLSFAIIWIWCVVSWLSMKLFRHSKGIGR